MKASKFDIQLRSIDTIRPYENNPRQNDGAVDAVAASLNEFGFRQPIVVDGDGVIIAGHTRFKAAQKLGLEKVPVHVATDLSPEQVRAYRIADNWRRRIRHAALRIRHRRAGQAARPGREGRPDRSGRGAGAA